MMLRLIFFFSTVIWLSSSQSYLFPSDDKANHNTAEQYCRNTFTGGRLYRYRSIYTYTNQVRKYFRNYRFLPCPVGENCDEYYVGVTRSSECQVLRPNEVVIAKYTDCTTPRRYICEGNRINCNQPAIEQLCQGPCKSLNSYSYECTCRNGYTLDTRCIDADECSTGTHQCHALAGCTNSVGSYQCRCKAGSRGNGKNCQDIDECSSGNHQCHKNAECKNSISSYQCSCRAGYEGDGKVCQVSINPTRSSTITTVSINPTRSSTITTDPARSSTTTRVSINPTRSSTTITVSIDPARSSTTITDISINATAASASFGSPSNFVIALLVAIGFFVLFLMFGLMVGANKSRKKRKERLEEIEEDSYTRSSTS